MEGHGPNIENTDRDDNINVVDANKDIRADLSKAEGSIIE